jgi:uncharacterized membrane protein
MTRAIARTRRADRVVRRVCSPLARTTQTLKKMDTAHTLIEIGAVAIEAMAVALIAGAFLFASIRFLLRSGQRDKNTYESYKLFLGRALSLGLEFLVAADVIRTVTIAPTFTNIGILALVVLTRTFLSWSLAVEMEGRWPWQPLSRSDWQMTV